MDRFGLAELGQLMLGLGIFVALGYLVTYRAEIARFIMSRWPTSPTAPVQSANQSVDQSAPTGLNVQTSARPLAGLEPPADRAAPDMDAEQTGLDTPRISRYLTDEEFIVFLATQKLRNGKYRLSANDIVKTAKGDRTEVLAIVRQVRESAPVFPPLSEEQRQLRAELRLDGR